MPTYEYRCESCQMIVAQTCSIADSPVVAICPYCQGRAHKIISPTIHFVGKTRTIKGKPKPNVVYQQDMSVADFKRERAQHKPKERRSFKR